MVSSLRKSQCIYDSQFFIYGDENASGHLVDKYLACASTGLSVTTLGTQDHKNTGVSYNFLSFYSITLKLGTKKEIVIL